ncbi:Endochitinase (Chitinase) [Melia azedarach]|uniref:Endochitinase (Chitinase) n=1 Tax=Melia azedarach TaxID=155640 RepID=A0ACC1XXV7_MELAZ|nr:Endochitinase (Chitinase) [Melia azedarach]
MKLLMKILWALALCILVSEFGALAEQCGSQAGGALCPGGLCCSKFGYCGNTPAYCTDGCQSQCNSGGSPTPSTPTPSGGGGGDVGSLISRDLFEQILKHRNDANCPAKGFYTYDAFIAAAKSFGAFGTTGDTNTRKREIAAFLAQTSHETTGGWPTAPDGPYSWGYCFKQEQGNPPDYCVQSQQWPCAPGKKYFGRGPIQISYNYNYGPAGKAINADLLNNPDAVANDATISFKTAFWFWMTPQSPKPSCHDVITGRWQPSAADTQAGRVPGYGVITNIINGGIECSKGSNPQMQDRIGFYKRYCDILGVSYGNNLDCNNQRPFGA